MSAIHIDLGSWLGIVNLGYKQVIMLLAGMGLIYLGIKRKYEPLLLLPIGLGMLLANIPPVMIAGKPMFSTDVYDPNSPLYYLYFGLSSSIYPALIFLGIGAMTDFGPLLASPRLIFIGASA